MKSFIKAILIFLFAGVSQELPAQDAHLSQYFNSPAFFNPANIGVGIDNIRIAGIYRSQWAGVSPFKTQSIAVDKIVKRVGFGAIITNNSAGDAGISRLSLLGGLSYSLPLGDEGKELITAGVQVGLLQKSFNPANMSFDEQYSNDVGYDPNLSSGEVFANTKVTRPDMSAGIAWHHGMFSKDLKFKPFASIAFYHINQPKESFIEEDNVNPIRTNISVGAAYKITEGLELQPMALLMKQQDFQEQNYGILSTFSLNKKNMMQLGAFIRSNDAIIAYAGYQMNKIFMGLSYDINNSQIGDAAQGANAFEVSLVYTPQGKNKNNMLKKPAKKVNKLKAPPVQATEETVDNSAAVKLIPNPEAEAQPVKPVNDLNRLGLDLKNSTLAYKDDGKGKKKIAVLEKPRTEIRPEGSARKSIVEPGPDLAINTNKQPVSVTQPATEKNATTGNAVKENPVKEKVTKENPAKEKSAKAKTVKEKPVKEAPVVEPPTSKPQPETITYTVFETVFFHPNNTAYNIDNRFDKVEAVIDYLYKYPDTKIILLGHTDEREQTANPDLSIARAEVIKQYMIGKGIDAARISTRSLGDSVPYKGSEEASNPNSRVEISLATN